MEAISQAGTVLGVRCHDGIIIAAERKVTSKLLDEGLAHEKIYPITEYVYPANKNTFTTSSFLLFTVL